jgi:hypothetical protein
MLTDLALMAMMTTPTGAQHKEEGEQTSVDHQGWFNFKSKSMTSSAKHLQLPKKWDPSHSVPSRLTFMMQS